MAYRMQQRRGTASQWTTADPILAAGEIGYETDTGFFKIGDGTNLWSDLSYFKDLGDLAGSFDDYVALTEKGAADGVATLDADAQVPLSQLSNLINNAPEALDTLNEIASSITDVNGLVNTAIAAAVADEAAARDVAIGVAIGEEVIDRDTAIEQAITTEVSDRDAAISLAVNTSTSSTLSTKILGGTGIDKSYDSETGELTISANSSLATDTEVATAVSDHNADTTNVHGISDTSALATKSGTETLTNKTISAADNTVTINLSDVIDVTASASEVNILDGATLSVTELNYVDGVTSSIQTQLDAKAPTANPTFTGTLAAADISITGDLTVGGTTTTVNATDLVVTDPLIYIGEGNDANVVDLGLVSSFNDGSYQHAGIVRDATDGVWKLFSSVEDEPTTTVNFSQAVYDTLKVGGIEYSDGVQVKQGVPSLTAINQQTSSYTTVLADRDKLVEVSSASGVTVTIPADSSVAYPVGTSIDILQTGAGQVTIAGAGGVTVNATPGLKLRTQWSSATLFKRATDTWVVFGDLSA